MKFFVPYPNPLIDYSKSIFFFVSSCSGGVELIETTVLPNVGEDVDRQYVCITLQVIPCKQYPDVQPKWNLRNPRGLDDMSINKIRKAIEEKLNEAVGQPVVFDLIEVIREHLTDSNLPSGQCVICLYGFQDGDEFTKTICNFSLPIERYHLKLIPFDINYRLSLLAQLLFGETFDRVE